MLTPNTRYTTPTSEQRRDRQKSGNEMQEAVVGNIRFTVRSCNDCCEDTLGPASPGSYSVLGLSIVGLSNARL